MTNNNHNNDKDNHDDDAYRPTIRTITAFISLSHHDFLSDSDNYELSSFPALEAKIGGVVKGLKLLERTYKEAGYNVQTLRIATNPFGEWLVSRSADDCFVHQKRLVALDHLLSRLGVFACAVGPALDYHELACCRQIVATSNKFSCSYMLQDENDVHGATQAAQVIYDISSLHPQGLNNFQFCVAAKTCRPWIPFFPIAYHERQEYEQDYELTQQQSEDDDESGSKITKDTNNTDSNDTNDDKDSPIVVKFAIGLENGPAVRRLLQDCGSIANIPTVFREGMLKAIEPIQNIAKSFSSVSITTSCRNLNAYANTKSNLLGPIEKIDNDFRETILKNFMDLYPEIAEDLTKDPDNEEKPPFEFIGIDTSVNPSLDEDGSVAGAIECLDEVHQFGGPGTMAAAAAITTVLQSLEGIQLTGYCGLMLPVCEDQHLARLASVEPPSKGLNIVHLLNISSVCGVGVDTVPIPGKNVNDHAATISSLRSLLLDVVGLATRWNKPLTCRVFPVPGQKEGELADFGDSPHMINSNVFSLEY
jgi:uncharacterized protein (UPF0210 family)